MTLEELKARPDFVTELTPSQQGFVIAFCSNGADKIKAAAVSYQCSEESAVTLANRNLRHPVIRRLVETFYNRTDEKGSKDEALAILWKRIQACTDDGVLLDYLHLYGKWQGFEKKAAVAPPEPTEEKSDWDEVYELERQQRAG